MELTRLFDLIPYQIEKYNKDIAFSRKEEGAWKTYSSKEAQSIIDELSLGFLAKGILPGEKVAIISENRPEWNFIDLALQQIGVISVPMYPTITVADYGYIFDHADVKIIFAGDQTIYDKAVQAAGKGRSIYSFDRLSGVSHWTELQGEGKSGDHAGLATHKANVKPEDLFTIIYTSGTTGKPKGVMLTHANVLSNLISVSHIMSPPLGTSKVLSFLPLCHIFERTASFCFMYMGYSIYYAENMETIGDNLKEVQPHLFNTVPRLLEKVYDKIVAKGVRTHWGQEKIVFLGFGTRT